MSTAKGGTTTTTRARVRLCFLYFFLVMTSYYMLKPVREALFLDSQGIGNFPKVHILLVFVTLLAAQVYDFLGQRFRGGWLAVRATPFFVSSIVLYWAVLRATPPDTPAFHALVWIYYLGVSLFACFSVALFWALTHGAFTPDEGKSHYGFIGAGGILGGAAGGQLTGWLVPVLGSSNLLLVSAAVLLPCLPLAALLDSQRLPEAPRETRQKPESSLVLLFKDRYLGAMGLMIVLTLGVEEFGDHQTQRVLHDCGLSRDQITVFYGHLYTYVNVLGCAISLLVTRFVQTRFGPGPGLVVLQMAAALKAISIVFSPKPETLLVFLSLDLALHYSIFQSSKELLYTPAPADLKFRAKTMIDTFLFRLGAGSAAVIVLTCLLTASQAAISACLVSLACCASLLGVYLHRRYFQLLREGYPVLPGKD